MAHPSRRGRLVDAYLRARVLHFHAERIVSKLARGELPTAEGSIAKLALTDLLARVADLAVDLQGRHGVLQGTDALIDPRWALLFLGYPGVRIAGGTDEIMRNVTGERVLGLPKEPRTDRDAPFRELP